MQKKIIYLLICLLLVSCKKHHTRHSAAHSDNDLTMLIWLNMWQGGQSISEPTGVPITGPTRTPTVIEEEEEEEQTGLTNADEEGDGVENSANSADSESESAGGGGGDSED